MEERLSVTLDGHRVECVWAGRATSHGPTIIFLHEGLGSIAGWRDFPAAVANASGTRALVYDRWGHGGSEPLSGPRDVSFMHEEAGALRHLLDRLHLDRVVLFGHSDGGSIALIAAAHDPRIDALVLEAPHLFVETKTIESIAAIRRQYLTTDLPARLRRQHGDNTDPLFRAWTDVWLSPAFRAWSIEPEARLVRCRMLAFQGTADPYGTFAQLARLASCSPAPLEQLVLEGCGHDPHRDCRDEVLARTVAFLAHTTPSAR